MVHPVIGKCQLAPARLQKIINPVGIRKRRRMLVNLLAMLGPARIGHRPSVVAPPFRLDVVVIPGHQHGTIRAPKGLITRSAESKDEEILASLFDLNWHPPLDWRIYLRCHVCRDTLSGSNAIPPSQL
jgi:hypothetical protein